MTDFNDVFDDINEQRKYSRAGFSRGYSLGEEAGWREGFLFGLKKGANLATEIGFYQGYTTAWLTLLEKQDQGKARKMQALKSLHEMARTFPLEEQLVSGSACQASAAQGVTPDGVSFGPKLSKIRAKFRHVQSLLMDQPKTSGSAGSTAGSSGISSSSGGHVHLQPQSTTTAPQAYTSYAAPAAAAQAQQQYQQWLNNQIHRSRSPSAFVVRDPSSFDTRGSTQVHVDHSVRGTFGNEMSF